MERLEWPVVEHATRLQLCELAYCDPIYRRPGLQPCGRVDDVAGHDAFAQLCTGCPVDHGLSCVDPDSDPEVEMRL